MADPQLAAAQWYHGLLPREDIKAMVKENGDYLVRMSEPSKPGTREFVLSVMFDKERDMVKHFVIKHVGNKFSVEKQAFDSVNDLVKHYVDSKQSLTSANQVFLKTAVGRRPWQLEHCDIECTKKLGEGAFGEVHKGTLKLKKGGKKADVAIKLAKLDNLTKEQIKDIMREARLMRFFDHPNVVKLYGVAAFQEPLMILMELATDGALDNYLQKNEISLDKKMEMCVQGAWGVEYLHEKNCLHRDIAARNCLYGHGQVKISDFGLSRTGTIYQMNPKNKVPIRWLAPETLRTAMYSQKTDVWSFGIMCWEIFHNGQEPYPGMPVMEMNLKVKGGYRMPLNDVGLAPETIKLIESRMWPDSPNERFSMSDIAKALERITHISRPDFVNHKDYSKTGTRKHSKNEHSKDHH